MLQYAAFKQYTLTQQGIHKSHFTTTRAAYVSLAQHESAGSI